MSHALHAGRICFGHSNDHQRPPLEDDLGVPTHNHRSTSTHVCADRI